MPRKRKPDPADGLNGPAPPPTQVVMPPGLAEQLSEDKQRILLDRVARLRVWWRPMTDNPQALDQDLLRLIDWVLDGDSPPRCPILYTEHPVEILD